MAATRSPLFGHYDLLTGTLLGAGDISGKASPLAVLTSAQQDYILANPGAGSLLGTATDNETLLSISAKAGVYRIVASDIAAAGGDIGLAVNNALALATEVFIPAYGGPYTQATRIDINGKKVSSNGAIVNTALTYCISLDGASPSVSGLVLVGTHSAASYMVRVSSTATAPTVNLEIHNGNSGVQCDAPDSKIYVLATEMRGTGVRLNGSACLQASVNFEGRNLASFGVYITGGARAKSLTAKKIAVAGMFTAWQIANRPETALGQCGLEAIGVTSDSPGQHIDSYYALASGDAGCSLSSDGNTLVVGRAEGCALNGLSLIGSDNQVGTMYASGCRNGVGFTPNAGGLSKRNSVGILIATGNTEYGADNSAEAYVDWVASAATDSSWCRYGLNVYKAATTPVAFGTIPPVHTAGTVSDGVNSWTYWTSDTVSLDASDNYIGFLNASGNGLGQTNNTGSGYLRIGSTVQGVPGLPVGGGYVPGTQAGSGSARGVNAVDMQHTRGVAGDVASGQESVVAGGAQNRSTGLRATTSGGFGNTSANTASVVAGGDSNTAGASYSWIPGGRQADVKVRPIGAWANGRFGTRNGSAQAVEVVQRASSADATPVRLTADGGTASATNTIAIQDSGCQAMLLIIEAYQTGGSAGTASDCATWQVSVLASRAAVGGTRIAGGGTAVAPTLTIGASTGWRVSITADTTLGSVNISGTGEANKTIEWVARWVAVEKAA